MNMLFNMLRGLPVLDSGIVNLKSGSSFKGVIYQRRGKWLVLRSAEILQDRNRAVDKPLDGEIWLQLADIDFIQAV